jgi:rhomboid protease GluP
MRTPYLTILLILANLVVLGLQVAESPAGTDGAFSSSNPFTLRWLKVNELVRAGEVDRLLRSMFLHLSLIHIAMNMFILWDLGRLAETLWGSARFFIIYMGAGLLGALASFAVVPNPSAGASGAVFGIAGALLAARFLAHEDEMPFPKQSLGYIGIFVVYNIVQGFSRSGIDNAAHIGGMVGGALLGFALLPRRTAAARLAFIGLAGGLAYLFYGIGMGTIQTGL